MTRVHAQARPTTPEPDDLDPFWDRHLAAAREVAEPATFTPYRPEVYGELAVDDVTFSGAQGAPIRAWFLRPRSARGPLPCLVSFIGYGGGRGVPADHTTYAAAGYAELVMDTRGQGGEWSPGGTGDPGAGSSAAEHPGVLTRGILSPDDYYYTRLFVDAVRAVDTASEHPDVDAARLAVGGASQGGALALAAAALAPDVVRLCHADVPFLCDIEGSLEEAEEQPYTELIHYLAQHVDLVDRALATVAHVDCALLARRIRARTLMSVGLKDPICPPAGIYAAYNAIEAPKRLAVHRYADHSVPSLHGEVRLADFAAEMGAA
jgi:cephalosporin-C deacetylase